MRLSAILILLSTIAALSVLLLVEGSLRLLRVGADQELWEAESIKKSLDFLKPCAPQALLRQPSGTLKVVVLGESSAGILWDSFSRLLETNPSAPVYVHDCSQGGSSLLHLEKRFEEVLSYEPDAIVILFGHNTYLDIPMNYRQLKLAQLARMSRIASMFGAAPDPAPFSAKSEFVTRLEDFLRRAARHSKERGVRLQLSVPIGNLWYAPPFESESEMRAVTRARVLLALGRKKEAEAELEGVDGALAHFELGLLRVASGDIEAGSELLMRARDVSGYKTFRMSREIRAVLEAVHKEEGVELVDGEELLMQEAGPLPSWNWFIDSCHANLRAYTRVAYAHLLLLKPGVMLFPKKISVSTNQVPAFLNLAADFDADKVERAEMARSVSVAVPYWLEAPQSRKELFEWLDSEKLRALPAANRSRIFASMATGLQSAGEDELAAQLFQESPEPADSLSALEWGLYLLARGDHALAHTKLAPFAATYPVSWLIELLDESAD